MVQDRYSSVVVVSPESSYYVLIRTPVVVFLLHRVAALRTLHVNWNFFQGDEENPQLVVEYVTDIYNYLRYLESIQAVTPDYLAGQQVGDRDCCSTVKSFDVLVLSPFWQVKKKC